MANADDDDALEQNRPVALTCVTPGGVDRSRVQAAQRYRQALDPESDPDMVRAIREGKLTASTTITVLRVRPHVAPNI